MIPLQLSGWQPYRVAGFGEPVHLSVRRLSDLSTEPGFRRVQRRQESLQMLGSFVGRPLGAHDLSVTAAGKPVLRASDPHFSWSYSGSYVLLGVSEEQPIGVDLERLVELADADDLINRFCAAHGARVRRAASLSMGFLSWWTELEAATKAAGFRMVDMLDQSLAESIDRSHISTIGFGNLLIGAVASSDALECAREILKPSNPENPDFSVGYTHQLTEIT